MPRLSPHIPPLSALKAFEAVARLGSLSRAAKELSVTKSAISHQLRTLESTLGTALTVVVRTHARNPRLPGWSCCSLLKPA